MSDALNTFKISSNILRENLDSTKSSKKNKFTLSFALAFFRETLHNVFLKKATNCKQRIIFMGSPITVASSPETIPLYTNNSSPDIETRNRTNAIATDVLGESPETTPPTSLIGRAITSFNDTSVENLSDNQKIACTYNILRNA
jgi:hypothetical protein